ncbi:MAPEG family protein [Sphaerotilus sp.]|uniref:MAPEG family protein n=1 Tax=Sphaerotilus sp. TaxID=2093942 RepID=UPI002ACDFE94|nr:MAPEG family protein [Sphaerotilus sp.]MDZ7856865.1 MAPEG family protein [Sphaerotilus sp.]
MPWIDLVTFLALAQYLVFGALVGRARGQYGVKAPATTGNELFERHYRVQMNTLELLVVFVPSLWMAARYWSPVAMAAIGAVYLVGRVIYQRAYTRAPAQRALGFMLSIGPVSVLLVAAFAGAVRAALAG